MKSYLWLYTNAPVDEESPAWIEGLADGNVSVLGEALPISDFIPFEPALDVTIRIDMDGYSFVKETKNQVFNYCSVTYDDSDHAWYYFVRQVKWRANNTLALVLHMDVINSLLASADFAGVLEPRTMIEREHENRYKLLALKDGQLHTVMKVDNIGEGLGAITLNRSSRTKIVDEAFPSDMQSVAWSCYYGKKENDSTVFYVLAKPVGKTIHVTVSGDKKDVNQTWDVSYEGCTKIIEMPYLPFFSPVYDSANDTYSFEYQGGGYSIGAVETSHSGYAIGTPYETLTLQINEHLPNVFRTIANQSYVLVEPIHLPVADYLAYPRTLIDTKLYNSDFYSLRYVYDSYSFSPAFERMDFNDESGYYSIDFYASAEASGAFAFKFTPHGFTYSETSDFEQWLVSARNNEMTLLNNEYLNYLLNGYNYNVKSQNLGIVNSVLFRPAMALTATAINPVFGLVGTASSIIGSIKDAAQSEISRQQKLADESAKSITTMGSDNLSIMRSITENKLWKMVYQPTDTIRCMLDDLFYFYGYKRGYQGVPNATSRVWFNFVQCVPKWNPTFARSCKSFLDELGKKFQNGITFFHHHDVSSQPSWMTHKGYDLDQKSENWETIITGV